MYASAMEKHPIHGTVEFMFHACEMRRHISEMVDLAGDFTDTDEDAVFADLADCVHTDFAAARSAAKVIGNPVQSRAPGSLLGGVQRLSSVITRVLPYVMVVLLTVALTTAMPILKDPGTIAALVGIPIAVAVSRAVSPLLLCAITLTGLFAPALSRRLRGGVGGGTADMPPRSSPTPHIRLEGDCRSKLRARSRTLYRGALLSAVFQGVTPSLAGAAFGLIAAFFMLGAAIVGTTDAPSRALTAATPPRPRPLHAARCVRRAHRLYLGPTAFTAVRVEENIRINNNNIFYVDPRPKS